MDCNSPTWSVQVYFALQGDVSLSTYANNTMNSWKGAEFAISKLAAICEITNRPQEFVSSNPYLVCNQLDWIQCRVLVVQRNNLTTSAEDQATTEKDKKKTKTNIKTIPLDPKFPLTLSAARIAFPDVEDKLQRLEDALGDTPDDLHESDNEILKDPPAPSPTKRRADNRWGKRTSPPMSASKESDAAPTPDPFEPADAERLKLLKMLPPPKNPSRTALSMIQKEMKAMLKTQEKEGPTKAGFFYDPVWPFTCWLSCFRLRRA